MRPVVARLSLSLLLALGLVACGGPIVKRPAPADVEIESGAFVFRNQAVRAGVAIPFVNTAHVGYTVCLGRDGRCDVNAQGAKDIATPGFRISPGETHFVTFSQPGAYPITCVGRPNMNMTLYVASAAPI